MARRTPRGRTGARAQQQRDAVVDRGQHQTVRRAPAVPSGRCCSGRSRAGWCARPAWRRCALAPWRAAVGVVVQQAFDELDLEVALAVDHVPDLVAQRVAGDDLGGVAQAHDTMVRSANGARWQPAVGRGRVPRRARGVPVRSGRGCGSCRRWQAGACGGSSRAYSSVVATSGRAPVSELAAGARPRTLFEEARGEGREGAGGRSRPDGRGHRSGRRSGGHAGGPDGRRRRVHRARHRRHREEPRTAGREGQARARGA